MKILLLIGILVLSVLSACKKDCSDYTNPECPNFNPCRNKKPVEANFEIGEGFNFIPSPYLGDFHPDILFMRGKILFRPVGFDPKDTSIKYTWILGSEIIHKYSFYRDFQHTRYTLENNIPITLIVQTEPDKSCFPNDNGIDTLTKYIRFYETPCECLSIGDFKVLYEGETDSVIIRTRSWEMNVFNRYGTIKDSCSFDAYLTFINFNNSSTMADTLWGVGGYSFYSKLILEESKGGGETNAPYNGFLKVDPLTWTCFGEYQVLLEINKLTPLKRFHGRKMN